MLLRPPPPPLQLMHDNTIPESERRPIPRPYPRPPPPRAQWRIVKVFKKVYRSNWRTAVIAVAAINTMRFFFSATNAFEHVTPDTRHYFPRLARVSATLGCIYFTSAIIQAFGILSASLKRIWLIRIYTYLSFLGVLLITAAGLVSGLSYFLLGEDLVMECIVLSLTGSHHTQALYHNKPLQRSGLPSLRTAYHQCVKAYSHPPTPAPLLPLSLILFSLLPSTLFFFLSYVYYKQTVDPTHAACLIPGFRANTKAGSCTPTHIPRHTGASANGSTEGRGRSIKRETGRGKARAPDTRQRVRARPSGLLPLERYTLLGNTSASSASSSGRSGLPVASVDVTSTMNPMIQIVKPAISTTCSPYDVSPGPPSFRHGHDGGRGVGVGAGHSRVAGPLGVEIGRSVWFAKTQSGGGGSGGSEGLGYSYKDAYGGRLI